MCKGICKCKRKSILVKVNMGEEGNLLIEAFDLTFVELKTILEEYKEAYDNDKISCSFQDYLKEKKVEFTEPEIPTINI